MKKKKNKFFEKQNRGRRYEKGLRKTNSQTEKSTFIEDARQNSISSTHEYAKTLQSKHDVFVGP